MTDSQAPEIVTLKAGLCLFIAEGNTLSKYRGFAQVRLHPKIRLAGGRVFPYQHPYRKRSELPASIHCGRL
jgi:hypothetical protein